MQTTSSLAAEEAETLMRPQMMSRMCDDYLDRLIEEEKPENEIEEEYKAKRNKVFMWQCRRLFCQQYLHVYAKKDVGGKTDFMDFVRMVKGGPAVMPDQKLADESALVSGTSGPTLSGPDLVPVVDVVEEDISNVPSQALGGMLVCDGDVDGEEAAEEEIMGPGLDSAFPRPMAEPDLSTNETESMLLSGQTAQGVAEVDDLRFGDGAAAAGTVDPIQGAGCDNAAEAIVDVEDDDDVRGTAAYVAALTAAAPELAEPDAEPDTDMVAPQVDEEDVGATDTAALCIPSEADEEPAKKMARVGLS